MKIESSRTLSIEQTDRQTLAFIELLTEPKIYVYSISVLLENSTHLTQPLDIRIFSPLKNEIKKMTQMWSNHPDNRGKTIGKYEIVRVTFPALVKALSNKSNIKEGFRASGLYPWDPSQVDFSRMEASNVFAQETSEAVDGVRIELNDVPNLVDDEDLQAQTTSALTVIQTARSSTEVSVPIEESEFHSSAEPSNLTLNGSALTGVLPMSSSVSDTSVLVPGNGLVSVSSVAPIVTPTPDTTDHLAPASDVPSITESSEPSSAEPEASYNPVMQFSKSLSLEDRKRR